MSTEGGGTVMLVPAALVVAPAMVVVGAIAGTGYLIVRSAMYCGKKLDENYKARCQTWTDAQLANYQADRANRVDTKALVAATLAQIAASRANVANVQTSLDELTRTRFETEIDTALARLRGAVDSATQPSPTASADIRALKAQVRVELEGSERLPASARSAI